MSKTRERFTSLFTGSGLSHGLWHADRGAETIKGPATPEDFERHLTGVVGLGIVPVREDGTCRFAAVDVDVTTVNHAEVFAQVTRRKLPLTVCRSKSGGAHLYVFIAEPGLAAPQVREKLRLWASLLGFPSAEIFPKQTRAMARNLGNWINLPYFAGDKTTRYAVGEQGALTLTEFFGTVSVYDPVAPQPDERLDAALDELPPCLRALTQSGLPEGMRNQGLFNFGVFFRKSDPKTWQDKLQQFNLTQVKPPLTFREFQTIAKSLAHTRYQYTCEQSPIRELCDQTTCLRLKFGVGHKPWEELDRYDDLLATHLRKVLTSPPRYVIEVNGHDLTISFEEFKKFSLFRDRVLQDLDLVVRPQKQAQWELQLKDLLRDKQDVEAPADASFGGQVIDAVSDFLAMRDKARSVEDLLRGLPVTTGDRVAFRVQDLVRHLQSRRLDQLTPDELFTLLKSHGCQHARLSVRGRKIFAWSFALAALNEQTEDLTAPEEFEKSDPEASGDM